MNERFRDDLHDYVHEVGEKAAVKMKTAENREERRFFDEKLRRLSEIHNTLFLGLDDNPLDINNVACFDKRKKGEPQVKPPEDSPTTGYNTSIGPICIPCVDKYKIDVEQAQTGWLSMQVPPGRRLDIQPKLDARTGTLKCAVCKSLKP